MFALLDLPAALLVDRNAAVVYLDWPYLTRIYFYVALHLTCCIQGLWALITSLDKCFGSLFPRSRALSGCLTCTMRLMTFSSLTCQPCAGNGATFNNLHSKHWPSGLINSNAIICFEHLKVIQSLIQTTPWWAIKHQTEDLSNITSIVFSLADSLWPQGYLSRAVGW